MAKHGRYKIVRRVADGGGMAESPLRDPDGAGRLSEARDLFKADPQHHLRRPPVPEHVHRRGSHFDEPSAQQHRAGIRPGRSRVAGTSWCWSSSTGGTWDASAPARPRRAPRLPRELALYIITDVCRALAYAHSTGRGAPLGIVHRTSARRTSLVRLGRGEGDGLRHRQGDEHQLYRHRRRQREGRLHVPRAGDRVTDRRALGSLLARNRSSICHDPGRPPVRRTDRARDACCACRKVHLTPARGHLPPEPRAPQIAAIIHQERCGTTRRSVTQSAEEMLTIPRQSLPRLCARARRGPDRAQNALAGRADDAGRGTVDDKVLEKLPAVRSGRGPPPRSGPKGTCSSQVRGGIGRGRDPSSAKR